ncbi:hypothetical protein L4D09_00565 [Photobacterium makurazakiensis]|uniref:hypothetical protein n=1 Tax=Photobacterium makurazakiensis TaxID=2910234 RepID=UPI003D1506AE
MESTVVKVFESENSVLYSTCIDSRNYKLVTDFSKSRAGAVEELLVSNDIATKGSVEIRDIQVREQSGTHTELTVYAYYFPAFIDVSIQASRNLETFNFQVKMANSNFHYSSDHPLRASDITRMSLKTHYPDIKDFKISLIKKETKKMPSEIEVNEYSHVVMKAVILI